MLVLLYSFVTETAFVQHKEKITMRKNKKTKKKKTAY